MADVAQALLPVDAVHVHVLVDNVSDLLSSTPASVISHTANVASVGLAASSLTGSVLCCASWGLSLGIELRTGFRRTHLRLVVFSTCSHAGIVNVLRHAQTVFPAAPLHAVMGGLHLAGPANEATIPRTVDDLGLFDLARIVPAHCTGWRAVSALARSLGDVVTPSAVGQTHVFGSP